jgi:alkylhydroperoxidase family enzyme
MERGLGSAILNPKSSTEMLMAWIKVIREDEAQGELKSTYSKMIEPWGGVDNIMKIHSLNVPSLKAHHLLYATLMRGKSELSRVQREVIAVIASVANHCKY